MLLALASLLLAGGAAAAPALTTGAAASGPAATQPAMTGTVRLYVPFSAGGEADGSARNFLRSAAQMAGGGPIIETLYLTAESGGAASRAVKGAPPDGRTLLLARVGNLAILPALAPHTAVPSTDFIACWPCWTRRRLWQAGTEALGATPRIRAIPDPAQYLRQQALFYERLVMPLGARP